MAINGLLFDLKCWMHIYRCDAHKFLCFTETNTMVIGGHPSICLVLMNGFKVSRGMKSAERVCMGLGYNIY